MTWTDPPVQTTIGRIVGQPAGGKRQTSVEGAWSALSAPEQAVLEQAWVSCAEGTTGVGTAVLDEYGEMLAIARNTTRGTRGGMPLVGSYVAHAEINAIAQITTARPLDGCTVLSSLLPCVMCAGAMVMSHVGRVRYVAPDPVFADLYKLSEVGDFIRRQWPVYDARPPDCWTVVAMLLGAHAKAIAKPSGVVMTAHDQSEPEVAGLIRRIIRRGVFLRADAAAPLLEVLAPVWDDVVETTACRGRRLVAGD